MAGNDGPRRGVIASLLRSRIAWGVAGLFAGFAVGLLVSGEPWHLPPAWGDIPTWITGVATAVLAVFAIITAFYARRAFREQSQEVSDQAEMLKVQSDRLGLQERQFEDQRKINQKRDELFDKQLSESEQRSMIIERQQAEMIDLEPRSTSRGDPRPRPGQRMARPGRRMSPTARRGRSGTLLAGSGSARRPCHEASLSGVYAEFEPSPLAPPGAASRSLIDPPERPRHPSYTKVRRDRSSSPSVPT